MSFKPQLAVSTITDAMVCLPSEMAKPVWTPSSVKGKPFATARVPVEIWGIGAFRFKGVPGHFKVTFLSCGVHSNLVQEVVQ